MTLWPTRTAILTNDSWWVHSAFRSRYSPHWSHDHICSNPSQVFCSWCLSAVIWLRLLPRITRLQKYHQMHLHQSHGCFATRKSPRALLVVIILTIWEEDSLSLILSVTLEPQRDTGPLRGVTFYQRGRSVTRSITLGNVHRPARIFVQIRSPTSLPVCCCSISSEGSVSMPLGRTW